MVKASVLISGQTDPFVNLATERLLMDAVAPDEQIMFLWQNSNTIVIGRNQDAYRECRVDEFERDGGRLARRLSGGGAVYHDTGNLNFTFVSPRDTYDVGRNMEVICKAVRSFGIDAQTSGRNDVEVEGAKFSGNAFFRTKGACCHHGTLMVAVDTGRLARYLQPDPRKLEARGVESVRSRVVNLQDLDARITIDSLREALIASFGENPQRGLACEPARSPGIAMVRGTSQVPPGQESPSWISDDRIDRQRLERERAFFASDEWRYGKNSPVQRIDHRFDHRYAWGGLDVQLRVVGGRVDGARVYSDALDADFIDALTEALRGAAYEADAFEERLEELARSQPSYGAMIEDCLAGIAADFGKGA